MTIKNLVPDYNAIDWYNPFNDFVSFEKTNSYNNVLSQDIVEGKIIKVLNSAAITRAIKIEPDTTYVIDAYYKMNKKPLNNTAISIGFGSVENFVFENVEINIYNQGIDAGWLGPFVFKTPSNASYLKLSVHPGQNVNSIDEKAINGDYDFTKYKNISTEYHQLILIEGDIIPDSAYIL